MKKAVVVSARESARVPDRVKKLRVDLSRHVEILQLPPESLDRGLAWLAEVAESADFLIVCFTSAHEATSEEEAQAQAGRYLALNAQERSVVPDRLRVIVALGSGRDRPHVPSDLKAFRCFDMSSSDGYDALLCRLVHEPLSEDSATDRATTPTWQAGTGAFKVVMGLAATIVGNQDRMRDFLVSNLGNAAWIVHWMMVVAVLALVITGVAALLRAAFDFARPAVEPRMAMLASLRSARWKVPAFVVASVLAALFAVRYFPRSPSIDGIVEKHLGELSRRLVESQMASGAFREHHDQGVGQAWPSAQALAGLLASQPTALSSKDYQRAFLFLRRTRIGDFRLRPEVTHEAISDISPAVASIDIDRFPKGTPTLAFAYDMFALIGGGQELAARDVAQLDTATDRLFSGAVNNQGWGYFEQFDWGVTEIAAWVGVALAEALRANDGTLVLSPEERGGARDQLRSIIALLRSRQVPNSGGFSPIADLSRPDFIRTYSTTMALWAMAEAASPQTHAFKADELDEIHQSMRDGVRWLGRTALADGWKVNPENPVSAKPFLGLTAQTLFVLERLRIPIDQTSEQKFSQVRRSVLDSSDSWLSRAVDVNDRTHDSDRYLFPTTYVTEGSTFLWYPWTVALMRSMAADTRAERENEAATAARFLQKLRARAGEFGNFAVAEKEYNYVAAEGLIGFGWPTRDK